MHDPPIPIAMPRPLAERAQAIADTMARDDRVTALARPTLSAVVRLALQAGVEAMEAEFGRGQGRVPVRKSRNLTGGEVSTVAVRVPQQLLSRLRGQIAAIHRHPQWRDAPPPTLAAVLRMALLHGLHELSETWLPPEQRPSIFADVVHVVPIGPDIQGESPMQDRLMTVAEVAEFLQMSKSWVYKSSAAGVLPVHRLGAALRFAPDEVRAYAAGNWRPLSGADLLASGRQR